MFDHSILNLTKRQDKRDAIEAALIKAKEEGVLTYTDIMLNHQEIVTFAFEVMDGVVLDSNNVPQYGQTERIEFDEPVRLLAIDPAYDIRLHKWESLRIPGTNTKEKNRIVKAISFGNDATIDDRLDNERPARRLLWEHGWPVRQFRSRTGEVGQIVELKWLERVAQLKDAPADYRELYAALKARIEAPRAPDIKTKSAPKGAQEIRP